MKNVQRRVIAAPPREVGRFLDELTDPDRSGWPTPEWPALLLDRGLAPGSAGGHGPIRYTVTAHDPGRRVVFAFTPGSGLTGRHELLITPDAQGNATLVHTIDARTAGRMRWQWPLIVRWLHEALIHDLYDNAERTLTGTLAGPPARWSFWVRTLRRMRRHRTVQTRSHADVVQIRADADQAREARTDGATG